MSNVFKKIGSAKKINDFAPNIGKGRHRVALNSYKVKTSTKDQTEFVESEFVIIESDKEPIGAIRGWPWFINAPSWTGSYAQARGKEFGEAVQVSIGNDQEVGDFCAELAGPDQPGRGIVLDCIVTQVFGKDGRTPRLGANGREVFNIVWAPVDQNGDDIEAMRVHMDGLLAVVPAPKAPAVPTTVVTPAPVVAAAAATAKLGGLAALVGRK